MKATALSRNCFTVQHVTDTPSSSMEDVGPPQSALAPCSICGRTFRPDALLRHEQICQKAKAKQRKVFDSSKQRIEGTEIKNVPKQKPPTPKRSPSGGKQPYTRKQRQAKPKARTNWKEKHEELIRTIRAARGEDVGPSTGETTNGTSGSRPAVPAGYVECPSCNRNFSDRAADRHIAWCQEKKNRIPKSPASAEAVERLKARTKYKVPVPGKKNGTVSPSGSQGSKDGTSSRLGVDRGHQRTKSSPSTLDTSTGAAGDKAKKTVLQRRVKQMPVPAKPKQVKAAGVMKFKEKFPNHVSSPYRYAADDSYDPYKKADMQMRELIRGSTIVPKNPRTVPGVRTGGLNNNSSSTNGNVSDSTSYTSTNSGSENKLDEEMNYLNSKFAELSRPGFAGEFTNNWAKRMTENAALSVHDHEPPVSSSGSDGSLQGLGLDPKVPYRCHQCGTMYPVSVAKFCCECGARRLGFISLYPAQ
ncbi:uncharacterized protein LOC144151691 isoform X4 [Haemaphysalis longicornis]